MIIRSGVDLVYLPRFKRSLKRGGENFLRRLFHDEEVSWGEKGSGTFIQHLAGIFAAKEAVMKALDLPIDSWHEIKVIKNSKGSPSIQLTTYNLQLITYSLSISHDGDYCVAQFVAMLKK